jgi:hypothetical protein
MMRTPLEARDSNRVVNGLVAVSVGRRTLADAGVGTPARLRDS